MSEAIKPNPSAWRVTGGRMFIDTAHIGKSQADFRAAERKDGATVEPLYSDSDVSQLVEQRDALAKALEDVAASLSFLAYGEVKTFHARRIMNPAEATGAARAALAYVKGATP